MEKRFSNPLCHLSAPTFGCLTSMKLGRGGAADGRETELGNMVCLLHTFQMSLPKETAPKKE